jgi:hypothetical protein
MCKENHLVKKLKYVVHAKYIHANWTVKKSKFVRCKVLMVVTTKVLSSGNVLPHSLIEIDSKGF